MGHYTQSWFYKTKKDGHDGFRQFVTIKLVYHMLCSVFLNVRFLLYKIYITYNLVLSFNPLTCIWISGMFIPFNIERKFVFEVVFVLTYTNV